MQFRLNQWFRRYADWTEQRAGLSLLIVLALTIVFFLQLPNLNVQNDLQTFYPDDERTRVFETISQKFGGDSFSRSLFIRFQPKTSDGILTPAAVVEMETVQNELRKIPDVVSIQGLPDLVKLIRSGLHGGDPSFATLPVDGDELGYSFADIIQLTTQRLSSVNDFLSPQGNALVVARLHEQSDIIHVGAQAEALLKQVQANATDIELMSYGLAVGEFNTTTGADLNLIIPGTIGLLALLLLWMFRLPMTAWWVCGALIATIVPLTWTTFMPESVWSVSVGIAILLNGFAIYYSLKQQIETASSQLKIVSAVSLIFIAVGSFASWAAALGLAALVLIALSVRWLWEIYLPLAVVVVATVWTFGLAALFGITLSFLMIAVLPLLFGVGLDDALHLLIRLRQESLSKSDRLEAFREGLSHTGRTLWYTTLSSIAGFGALWLSSSPPLRSFGALATLAMLSAFLVTMTLIPAAYKFLSALQSQRQQVFSIPTLRPLLRPQWAAIWLLTVIGVGVVAFASGQQLKVFPYDLRWLLPPDSDQISLYENINEEFKNYDQVQLLLEGDVARLDVMRAMTQSLNPALSASPYVRQVRHLGRLLDDVRFSDAEAEARFLETFVESPDVAYQRLIDHARQQPSMRSRINALVHADEQNGYDATVVRIDVVRAHHPEAVSEITADIEQRLIPVIAEFESMGLNVSLSGSPFLESLSLSALKQGFFESMAWAFLLVGIVMAVLFRSVWWSLVCLVPIALVMALELAAIQWLGLRISAATALVAALGIGLGVDYTIHLAQRFRENGNLAAAVEAVSPALLAATGTTAIAFLSLMFGQIPWNRDFGLLSGLAVILAFLVSLWIFPSLLAVASPLLNLSKNANSKKKIDVSV